MSQGFVLSLLCRSLGLEVRSLCFSWERATVKKYPRQLWDQQNQVPGMAKNWSQGLCPQHQARDLAPGLCLTAASEWVSEWRFLGRRSEDKVVIVSDPLLVNWCWPVMGLKTRYRRWGPGRAQTTPVIVLGSQVKRRLRQSLHLSSSWLSTPAPSRTSWVIPPQHTAAGTKFWPLAPILTLPYRLTTTFESSLEPP